MSRIFAFVLVLFVTAASSVAQAEAVFHRHYYAHQQMFRGPGAVIPVSHTFPDGQEDVLEDGIFYFWYSFAVTPINNGNIFKGPEVYLQPPDMSDVLPRPYSMLYKSDTITTGTVMSLEVLLQGLGNVGRLFLTLNVISESCIELRPGPQGLPYRERRPDGYVCGQTACSRSTCQAGICVPAQSAPGTTCDDGNACTVGEV